MPVTGRPSDNQTQNDRRPGKRFHSFRRSKTNQTYLKFALFLNYRIGKKMTRAKPQSTPSSDFSPFCKGGPRGISQFEKSPLTPLFQRGVGEALCALASWRDKFI
jgi:hypothetical protein